MALQSAVTADRGGGTRPRSQHDAVYGAKRLLRCVAAGGKAEDGAPDGALETFLKMVSQAISDPYRARQAEAPSDHRHPGLDACQATFIEQTRCWLMRPSALPQLLELDAVASDILAQAFDTAVFAAEEGPSVPAATPHEVTILSGTRMLIEGYIGMPRDAATAKDDEGWCLQTGAAVLDQVACVLASLLELASPSQIASGSDPREHGLEMVLGLLGAAAIVLDSSCEMLSHRSAAELLDQFSYGCLPLALDLAVASNLARGSEVLDVLRCTIERIMLRELELGMALASTVIEAIASQLFAADNTSSDCLEAPVEADDARRNDLSADRDARREGIDGEARRRLQGLVVSVVDVLVWELREIALCGEAAPANAALLQETLEQVLSSWSSPCDGIGPCRGVEWPSRSLGDAFLDLDDALAALRGA
ncbi:uncharacterized protein PFL1_02176 [Pseudozyma flocculosa PF-1]|uniref:uncharacterized protein n=1 Tax=Pseudozyma flocculosa PF-1 TaxID=1277687 RepID=UPI00045612E8|nr:uncharacterized protein PFL1_02176 [Pseudozyma flocculosa PF-1]EPQ30059.1 hypothetical protein PFL1_02176 [Pseudozyma flocculosa PF-1]